MEHSGIDIKTDILSIHINKSPMPRSRVKIHFDVLHENEIGIIGLPIKEYQVRRHLSVKLTFHIVAAVGRLTNPNIFRVSDAVFRSKSSFRRYYVRRSISSFWKRLSRPHTLREVSID